VYLQVDPHSGAQRQVLVRDADDCTRLHIVGTATDGSQLDDEAIAGIFTQLGAGVPSVAPGHLQIYATWLEERARAGAVEAGWHERFAAMLRFSREHGWFDDETGTLYVHIQRPPALGDEDHPEVTR
jgi:hypothetical protein